MAASEFTPDLSKLDLAAVSGHITGICAEFAKTTPTPLDDIAVTYLSQAVTDWLKTKIVVPPHGAMMAMAATSDEADVAHIQSLLTANGASGRLFSPELIGKLVTIAKALLPILLPLLG